MLFLLFIVYVFKAKLKDQQLEWCWTQEIKDTKIDPINGGLNWAFVNQQQNNIKYKIYVQSFKKAFNMNIQGQQGISEKLIIDQDKKDLDLKYLGELQKIEIFNQNCDFEFIKIEMGYQSQIFYCQGQKILEQRQIANYQIQIQGLNPRNSPVLVSIEGLTGITPNITLIWNNDYNGFAQFQAPNVGQVQFMNLYLTTESFIQVDKIQTLINEQSFDFFTEGKKIQCPNKCNVKLERLLDQKDQVHNLECSTKIRDIQTFLFSFSNLQNYQQIIVQCPQGCEKEAGIVYGVGIHPEESIICKSAFLNGIIQPSGGKISIALLNGQNSYQSAIMNNIQSLSFQKSNSSFITIKIPDSEIQYRIVDENNNLAIKGRPEIKLNQKWLTFKASKISSDFPQLFCKQLGLHHNEILEKCSEFENQNYCGSFDQDYIQEVNCQNQTKIENCFLQKSSNQDLSYDHKEDLIIECIQKKESQIQNARLIDQSSKISQNLGRIENYIEDKKEWRSVCETENFNQEIAEDFCKLNYQQNAQIMKCDSNFLCGNQSQQTSKIICPKDGNLFKQCHFQNHQCNHKDDIVLFCANEQQPLFNNIYKNDKKKILNIDCDKKGFDIIQQNVILKCQNECDNENIWGYGIYSDDSSICASAQNLGIIPNDYDNQIIFQKSSMISYFQGMKGLQKQSFDKQLKQPTESFQISQNFKLTKQYNQVSSFLQKRQKLSRKSFIQLKIKKQNLLLQQGFMPIFEWQQTFDYKFNQKNQINFDQQMKLKTVRQFSLLTEFQLFNLYENQQIISTLDCGGFTLQIDFQAQLILSKNCYDYKVSTGFYVPKSKSIKVWIIYDNTQAFFYLDEKQIAQTNINFILNENIVIGKELEGQIKYIQLYDVPLGLQDLQKIKITPQIKQTNVIFTIDQRVCQSQIQKGKSPSYFQSLSNQESEGLDDQEIQQYDDQQDQGLILNCEQSGDVIFNQKKDKIFLEQINQKYQVSCPNNCHESQANIFGQKVYASQSSICKAAVHSGIINKDGGAFILQFQNGLDQYPNSYQNDVKSIQLGYTVKAFTFHNQEKIINLKCQDTIKNIKILPSEQINLKCPNQCSKYIDGLIFGDEIYSIDSSICLSAIHNGFLSDRGGQIQLQLINEQNSFKSIYRNGIWSQQKDQQDKAFMFLGDKNKYCGFFKEKFNNIQENWETKSNNWIISNFLKEKLSISMKQDDQRKHLIYNYTNDDIILSKNFYCQNYILTFNLFWQKIQDSSIYLRYLNENNYLSIDFNQGQIDFIKKIQGQISIIQNKQFQIQAKQIYNFMLILQDSQIQIYYSLKQNKKNLLIFNVTESELQNGRIGFGQLGQMHILDIKTQVFDKEETFGHQNQPIYDKCIIKATKTKIDQLCKQVYSNYLPQNLKKCHQIREYCQTCCNTIFNSIEKIYNYKCLKECLQANKELHFKPIIL